MANGHPAGQLYLPHWRYRPKLKGLSGIYINTAIRNLANSLIGIFIPIYIYKITGNFALVFLFYAIFRLATIVTTIPAAKIINKIGPDLSMFISSITRSIYFILLILAKTSSLSLWLAPVFGGITALYWLSYHSAFSSQSKKKRLSRQVANLSNITRLATIFAPLLGGFIADQLGFQVLFPAGVLLLVASSLPIFLDEYNKKERVLPLPKLEKEIFSQKNKNLFFAYFFQGIHGNVTGIAWPLILYLFLPNLEKIGGLTTFTLIISLITVNWFSRRINQFKILPFSLGNIARSLLWLLRGITVNPLLIIFSDPVFQVSSVFVNLPHNILLYQLGKKNSLSFFVQRELALHMGTFVSSLLTFFILFHGFSWPIVTLLAVWGINLSTIFMTKYSQTTKPPFEKFKIKLARL